MIEALHSFFVIDAKARWRALLWSWGIGTGVGAILSLSEVSYHTLASASIGSSTIAFVFFLAAYIHSPRLEPIQGRRSILNIAYAASALAIIAIVERVLNGPQAVYAAANELMKEMRTGKPISTAQALLVQEKARGMLTTNRIQGLSRNQVVSAYAIAKAASHYSKVEANPSLHPPNTNVIVSGQQTTFVFQPPVPMAMLRICHIKFTGIDFIAKTKGCSLVEAYPPDCRDVVIANSSVQEFTQSLDDIVWADVVFERCALVYHGGQLTLMNVLLKDCTVDVSQNVPESIREALLHVSTPITTTSEFPG
jgi:hypothetical protein